MSDIEMRLIKILKENIANSSLDDEKLLNSDMQGLGVNSLNFIKIIVAIEQEFDIEIDDSQLNYQLFGSIKDIVALIEENLN